MSRAGTNSTKPGDHSLATPLYKVVFQTKLHKIANCNLVWNYRGRLTLTIMMAGEISGYSATFKYLPIIRVSYCIEIYWLLRGSKFSEIWKQVTSYYLCKNIVPLFEIPASILPGKMASPCTAIGPDGTFLTRLSSLSFVQHCIHCFNCSMSADPRVFIMRHLMKSMKKSSSSRIILSCCHWDRNLATLGEVEEQLTTGKSVQRLTCMTRLSLVVYTSLALPTALIFGRDRRESPMRG